MPITEELYRLGESARLLNDGSEQLNRNIAAIDHLLGRLMIGLDYVHGRPLAETVTLDREGKRVIELAYLAYVKVEGGYHLAIKTVKVLESKRAIANETPGQVTALLSAPRRLRYAAVDLLPEVVAGLAGQVEEMLGAMQRRCETASALVRHLEQIAEAQVTPDEVDAAASSATSHRRQTMPAYR
jgi:hypothetical protein